MISTDEVFDSLEVTETLVIPQGPSKGLCVVNDELQHSPKVYPDLDEPKLSSVKLENDKLVIVLSTFPSVVKALIYLIEIIDPALYKVGEIVINNLHKPELSLKVLESVYHKHDVFLDIDKVVHIVHQN